MSREGQRLIEYLGGATRRARLRKNYGYEENQIDAGQMGSFPP